MHLPVKEKKEEIEKALVEINQISDFEQNEDVISKFRQIKIIINNLFELGIY